MVRSATRRMTMGLASSLFAFVLLVPLPLRAQVGSADVLGTVTDPSGAVVSAAKVTIKNLGTAAKRTTTTSAKGEYIFNTLPNGTYSLTVEAQGFKLYTVADFPLTTDARARYDVSLQTGAVTEKIEVTGQVAALQTDSSTVGSTIEDKTVQDLPLNARSFEAAIQIQPGVIAPPAGSMAAGTSPEDRRPSFVIVANGQSDALNNQMIDGFDNNERNLGLGGVRPSIDGIAEVKVDTSSYSAANGRAAGAVINVVTKGGSNQFHGSLYEYFRNDILDARDFFATAGVVKKAEYRQNFFGGSIGGPIRKDKTFFFADFEQDRLIEGQGAAEANVPTEYERTQMDSLGVLDLTDVNPSLAVIPASQVNPIMKAYFNLFPHCNACTANGLSNFIASPSKPQNGTNVDGRIDHHFSSNDLLFGRFAYNPVKTIYPEPFPVDKATGIYPGGSGASGFPGPSNTKSYNLQIDYVHIFNPNLLLDLKAGYTRVNISSFPFNYGTGASKVVGMPNVIVPGIPGTDVLPDVGGPVATWSELGSASSVPLVDINNTFQYAGALTWTRGTHNIKIGGGLIRRQVNASQDTNGGGLFLFFPAPPGGPPFGPYPDDRQNFITGNPFIEIRGVSLYPSAFRAWEPSAYIQDDWRLTPKLTLNLGVRYDVFTPITEALGHYSNFLPSCLTSSSIGSNCFILGSQDPAIGVNTDHKNVAPRIGFAYSITPKTVLRGGFGISYFPPDVGEVAAGASAPASVVQNYNPPYSFNFFQLPYWLINPGGISNGPAVPSAVDLSTFASNPNVTVLSAKPLNLRSSYVEMANLALQREMGANTFTIAWVGEFGRALLRTVNLDQNDTPGSNYVYATQLPNVNTITQAYNGAMSSYNAMQLVYNRRFTHGLLVNANYTWAHNLSNNGTNNGNAGATLVNDPSIDYGNTGNDVRHRIAVTGNYTLPFGKSFTGAKGLLVKGWQFNAIVYWQTGFAFTVVDSSNRNVQGISFDRPNVVASTKLSNPSISEWFNTAAFATQPFGTLGNERVGQLFGPHQRNADVSVNKDFVLTERWKMQFRAECFNLSNTPNFALPGDVLSQANFGQITSTSHNPRQLQFALKLLF